MAVGEVPVPGRALAIGAHPDDIEFQAGGTLAVWAAGGCVVDLLICTDGSKGTWDPGADLASLVATRQAEARDAATALGATGEVVFLDWVDGEVQPSPAAVSAVAREIRRLQPDVVLTHDPWKRYRLHPDHRNVGWIVVDAAVAARDPHFFPEHGLAAHRPERLLLFEADEPDLWVDVGGGAEAKLAALLSHRSQYLSTMDIADPGDEVAVERFRHKINSRMTEVGHEHGLAMAEAFKGLDL
jgi:LmbE family N-acetylglucosaminyl deacetylase